MSHYRAGSAGSRLAPEHLDLDRIRAARVLHLTGISAAISDSSRAAIDTAIEVARGAGVTVSFDVNHRSRLWDAAQAAPAYRAIAERADVVFAGQDEAALLTQERDPHAQTDAIAALGPRQVVIKLGAEGAIGLADGERAERLAVLPREVVRA